MKKIFYSLIAVLLFANTVFSQVVTASDCTTAVNVCTSNSFSVSPAGSGFVDFTTGSNVSNPTNNPAGIVPPGGSGCLKAGELNPTWMIINIQTPGTLEFSMGAGTGPGAQSGCYDWIMWPYNATTCAGINANTQAPIRCCWNNNCSGGTGLAAPANIPAGGFPDDFGAPINVNCGDRFILCFSNYSSVNTLVPLNFFGTAVVSCTPLSSTLSIASKSICPGAVATLSVPSSAGTTYTWQPGNVTGNTFTTSPAVTSTYTLFATNSCGTFSGTATVFVSPAINISFANTNGNCSPPSLGSSTVTATGGIGALTYSWSPVGGTTNVASNLTTNIYSMTVTDALGCKATATTSIIAPAPFSFSLNTSTGGTVLACNPSSMTINAVNMSTLTNVTYTWNPGNLNGSSVNITAPGVYTVVGQDLTVGSCVATQTIAISQNTTAPTITVNPTSANILCNGAPVTFTATSSTTLNVVGQWFGPPGVPLTGVSSTPLLMTCNAPGTYTVIFTNVSTGCSNTQTVSVTSNSQVPTMSVTANLGYTITCSVPCVSLAISSSSTIAPISYSWTNVTSSVTTSPANGGYSVCVPGNYIAAFKDGFGCTVTQTVTVLIDTARIFPTANTNLPSNSFTLTCTNNTLLATAISNPMLAANNYSWTVPPNLTTFTNQVIVNLANITSSTTPTNYTVLATNPANGCVGRQRVQFYKDIFVPRYNAVFTPSAITCANQCVQFSPQLASGTSTVPISFTFTSPAPTTTNNIPGSTFCAPGTYTMDYTNSLNGCSSTTTAVVPLNTVPPSTVPLAPVQIPCGQTTTIITAGTTTTSTSYSYTWAGPPGAGFSCASCYSTSVNAPGTYFVTIYNTINGCRTYNTIDVTTGNLNVSLTPNPASGYAPLGVSFDNTSLFTSSSGTMTTVWSYGNGQTATTTSLANTYTGSATPYPDGNTTYTAPGTYTVFLMMTQNTGTASCVGTATALVIVDIPSDLAVPNVFTPNGDGVNDNFTLLTTNITEITFTIFDRWGVKMYDVKSESGNVSWDGKNFGGKEVPVGTYFYILKAKGKDGEDYEQKGSISLFR